MGRVNSTRKRVLRATLYELQSGRCFWCAIPVLIRRQPKEDWRYATLDHLDERDSPNKGKFTTRRIVLSCARCNYDRSFHPLEHRLMMADQATWSLTKLEAA